METLRYQKHQERGTYAEKAMSDEWSQIWREAM